MHHSENHGNLSSPVGRIHLVPINSISFIDFFFPLVHCYIGNVVKGLVFVPRQTYFHYYFLMQ